MGMYTGLRIKVTVKEEYRSMINQINKGAAWSEFVEQFPFLSNYAALNRAGSFLTAFCVICLQVGKRENILMELLQMDLIQKLI